MSQYTLSETEPHDLDRGHQQGFGKSFRAGAKLTTTEPHILLTVGTLAVPQSRLAEEIASLSNDRPDTRSQSVGRNMWR